MAHSRTSSVALGLATLATLGLAVAQPVHAQISGFGTGAGTGANQFTTNSTTGDSPNAVASSQTKITGSVLQLTDGVNKEASSAYYNTKQSITQFNTSFTYKSTGGADGFGFVLQNIGLNALGNDGGALGYGGMTGPSAAQLFEIFGGGTGTGFNSGSTTTASTSTTGTGTVNLGNGDSINFNLNYNGTTLSGRIYDPTTGAVSAFSSAVNLSSLLGANTAYVGFSGATGGLNTTETISNFTYSTASVPSAAAATPVAFSGFNQDIVVNSATPTAGDTTSGFDATNNYVLYSTAANATGGLPSGTTFTSGAGTGTQFALGSATANNALLLSTHPTLTSGTTTYTFSPTGTITLTTPAKYSSLSFLTASTNGAATLSVTFNYAGGGTSTGTLITQDWFAGSASAINMGRVNVGNTNFSGTGPHLFESFLTADPTQTLNSITFTDTADVNGNTVAGIFAISGVVAPEPGETAAMLMGGLGLLGLIARKRRVNA